MPLQGSLSIERMCQLAGVSRVSFYRSLQERAPVKEDMEVRSVMQRIAVEHRRRYGYRRMSAELRRRGMVVNHKRVLRMMREDNLLCCAAARVRGNHGFRSRVRGLPESGKPNETDGDEPAPGSGHHLCPSAERICLRGQNY
jgi:putative transposase